MAPVEHQRFHLDNYGQEKSGPLVITFRHQKRRIKLTPAVLIISCFPKDAFGQVRIGGNIQGIEATFIDNLEDRDLSAKELTRPIKISTGQRLVITSSLTRRYVEIRHRAPLKHIKDC